MSMLPTKAEYCGWHHEDRCVPMPVSYTHLDVYKRQRKHRIAGAMDRLVFPDPFGATMATLRPPSLTFPRSNALMAVSYTHLDVYKRQAFTRASRSAVLRPRSRSASSVVMGDQAGKADMMEAGWVG